MVQPTPPLAHGPLFEQRIARVIAAQGTKAEPKKMFGVLAFIANGIWASGVTNKKNFLVCFDRARHVEISKWPCAKPMNFGGVGTKDFLFVDAHAVKSPKALEKWVTLSLVHILTIPEKVAKATPISFSAK